jgi:hypothetical protein
MVLTLSGKDQSRSVVTFLSSLQVDERIRSNAQYAVDSSSAAGAEKGDVRESVFLVQVGQSDFFFFVPTKLEAQKWRASLMNECIVR